ncbi:polyketide synthase [Drechmeria coniospora]|uniref:Polyketide synthase n=1 Tax=Drechmeria coniospora TaxID=98403 RepID=A0A151GVQ0_DRECN|nr:polyketide synthase [Drechmeria coniospora]KYK61102.1 polyketide synthase [Drechmeria coniospora]
MKSHVTNFLFFGDQTVEKLPAIRQLVRLAPSSRLVQRFLRQACDAVQVEVGQLPTHADQRSNIGNFDSILRLAEDNDQRGAPSEIVATVLMNIARIGELILYAEDDPSILSRKGNRSCILGFCTGELPAAIAAVAQDTTELVDLGVEATRIIFRMARELNHRSLMVDRTNGPWARTLLNISADRVGAILKEFHESQAIPRARQVCIGFVSEGWLTLFGPPTTLERLFDWSVELEDAPHIDTDARGGVHMETLPEVDVGRILGSSSWLERSLDPATTIISPYTCQPRQHRKLRALLEEIILDVGQRTLYLAAAMNAALELTKTEKLRVVMPGYTSHDVYLKKLLQKRGVEYTVASHSDRPALTTGREGSGLVAVVGMSGRFPGSGNINEFWEGLLQGKRYVQEVRRCSRHIATIHLCGDPRLTRHWQIPPSRFNLDEWYDTTGKEKNSTMARTGAFLDQPGLFDNRLFNMSPREAMQTDVQHRLLLTTSYEALEMAGYYPDGTPSTNRERIASFFGQTSDDWREVVVHQGVDIYFATGSCRAFGPGRLHHHFKWGGPSYSVDSACASSVAAVGLACSALLGRECDMALAGGGSLLLSPSPFSGLSRGGFLSTHGGCQTFQDDADGYVRGEGIGVVVLKRLEDALEDQDNILGIVRGSGRNYSSDASSMMHPSAASQQKLYRSVLEQSGVEANSISYVEMHGTGTQAGDFMEMSSVLSIFAEKRASDNPLIVGALKASIGHGEAAAGVCGLIKTLMMLQSRQVPPQPSLPGPINHRFPDLASKNVYIASRDMSLKASPSAKGTIRVFLNSFDASGGNSCLLLEEAPPRVEKPADPRSHHVVTLSGRSQKSLLGAMERYLAHLRENPGIQLADLAFSTSARRIHGLLRYAITASSVEQVIHCLEADLAEKKTPRQPPVTSTVIFVFTGQGSHYPSMGSHLWETSATFRAKLHDFQAVATAQGLPYFLDLISRSTTAEPRSDPDTVQIQLAILSLELALAALWRSWGIEPSLVLGHSLGEYAALCVAGVLTVGDALYLVGTRARIMAGTLTVDEYGMLAVNMGCDDVRSLLATGQHTSCAVACINASKMTVVSGPQSKLEKLQMQLKSDGIRCTPLSVPYGFHSPQLDPILAQFEEACHGVVFSTPQVPIVSTLLATVIRKEGTFSAEYLARQAREPVDFVGALAVVDEQKYAFKVFLEIGPDPICLGLVKATLGIKEAKLSLLASMHRDKDNWSSISCSLRDLYMAGASVDWPAFHRDFKSSVSLIDLPTYSFDEKVFWSSFPGREPQPAKDLEARRRSDSGIAPSVQGFGTTTLQRVLKETVLADGCSVTFESDLADSHLRAAVQGHSVADVQICSSSLLLDMALSAAQYAYRKHMAGRAMPSELVVRNCYFHRALVLGEKDQRLQVTATLSSSETLVEIEYHCLTADENFELGACQVILEPAARPPQAAFLVRSRIAALKASAGHQLGRLAVYRLFDSVVRYSEEYKGLEKVYLAEEMQDAVGQISMADVPAAGGHYLHHPFLLDSVVHLAGFLVNNGMRYSSDWACLSTGFDEWHQFKALDPSVVYTSYTFMEDSASTNNVVAGDVYVFDGDELVSVLTGLQFQKMKRTALHHLLSPSSAPSTGRSIASRAAPVASGATPAASNSALPTRTVADYEAPTPPTTVDDSEAEGAKVDLVNALFSIVAREVGVEMSDLHGDVNLANLGIDSLMAITIISVMQQETGVELAGTFFLDNSTTTEVIAALRGA